MVVKKLQEKAEVIIVAIPSSCNIRKKKHKQLMKYHGLKEEIKMLWRIKPQCWQWCYDPHTRRLAPADSKNGFRDLYVNECSSRNSSDNAQSPQGAGLL